MPTFFDLFSVRNCTGLQATLSSGGEPLPLRLAVRGADSFLDVAKRWQAEVREAEAGPVALGGAFLIHFRYNGSRRGDVVHPLGPCQGGG